MTTIMSSIPSKPEPVVPRSEPVLAAQSVYAPDELPIEHPSRLIEKSPYFISWLGAAYCGDSLEMLRALPSESVNLVVTSPPYALHFKKEYGNEQKDKYVEWFFAVCKGDSASPGERW